MNILPPELWEIVVHHCILWDENKPDMDALLLLHRTNKNMGLTASRLLNDIFDTRYQNDEDSACDWFNGITRPIIDIFYTRIEHICKQECAFNKKSYRQEEREYWRVIEWAPIPEFDSDDDTRSEISFDDDSFYGDMTKWVSEHDEEVRDDLCCAIETNSILLIHQLCTKWIQNFRQFVKTMIFFNHGFRTCSMN